MMHEFELPSEVSLLVNARNKLRKRYQANGLRFTLDGKLVGDIGEALAVTLYGITLSPGNSKGIDGKIGGRTVQVKTTGTARGPVFRNIQEHADILLFFDLDFESGRGKTVYNGLEAPVLKLIRRPWNGQRMVSRLQLAKLKDGEAILPLI
ncbi:MAG: hypothetical protein GXP05_11680 [Alphaproteobacteria bacterium]|nr:hypothetical protein [Alphaproteobacteria bacterium]